MIDRSVATSECPYCGRAVEHKGARIFFEDRDQDTVREALTQATGPVREAPEEHLPDPDPHSTLVYRYEHCTDPDSRLEVLAEGLREIYGTFTLDDLRSIDPKNAERLLSALLETCLASEIRYGVYRA